VDSLAAYASEVGRPRGSRIESHAAVAELDANLAAGRFQPHAYGILHPLAAAVPHCVYEELFQREVDIELHLPRQRVIAAKALRFARKACKLVQTSVQHNLQIGQNRSIVAHRKAGFNVAVNMFSKDIMTRSDKVISRRRLLQMGGAAYLAPAGSRPNIVIITTDQQFGDAMSCRIGKRYLNTPHMDSLAASGTLFSRAYCANPLCVPSRTSIYTGRYPVETGVEINDTSEIDARRFPCMGTIFKRAGYATGYFGKWHLPFDQKNPAVHGFDTVNVSKVQHDIRASDGAAAFIKTKRSGPFLLVASLLNPHNICQWPRHQELSEGSVGTPPPVDQCPPWRPNHAPQQDEPDAVTLMRRSYQANSMFPVGNFDEKLWREYIWAYYRMIEIVDARIGVVLNALRESGAEKDTLVLFSTDHGDCQGAHRWNQKTILYEEAARVPYILSWNGVIKAQVSDRLVNTGVDTLPTLCDYAGLPRPDGLPGLSLKQTRENHPFVVVSNHMVQGAEVDGRTPETHGRMLRSEHWKYTVYSEGRRREALVDLRKDPGEMVNQAEKSEHAEVLKQHREMLAKWCKQHGDRFPLAS